MHRGKSKRLPGKSSSFDKPSNNPGRKAGVFFVHYFEEFRSRYGDL